jgi:signal transduction histidine kinase
MQAARSAVPGLEVREALRKTRVKKKDLAAPAVFDLRGVAGGMEHEVRVDAAGQVQRVRRHEASRYPEYELPADAAEEVRLELVLTAQTSAAGMKAELARTARVLWTLGPLALLLTAAALVLLIRWQLAPLARIAREAGAIGAENASARIGPTGSAAELTQLRQAINSMLQRLGEGLDREKRFAATAAHELRTPLAQMRMNLDVTLRRERSAGEYREALGDLSADVQRLERLVLGLLQLTRATTQSAESAGAVAVGPLLRRVTEGRGMVYVDAGAGEGLWVRGDADLLASAIGNVIENAHKYAASEPPTLRIAPDGEYIRITIADRGRGIAEADRQRIFEPLTRLDGARSVGATAEGLGLGLAVARAAARAAGGELTCHARSDGGMGSEFVFTLRAAAAPAGEAVAD